MNIILEVTRNQKVHILKALAGVICPQSFEGSRARGLPESTQRLETENYIQGIDPWARIEIVLISMTALVQ